VPRPRCSTRSPEALPDPQLAPYLEGTDMDRQIAKQTVFLTMALGGPNSYTGAARAPRTPGWPGWATGISTR
jgi:hypothetical protein